MELIRGANRLLVAVNRWGRGKEAPPSRYRSELDGPHLADLLLLLHMFHRLAGAGEQKPSFVSTDLRQRGRKEKNNFIYKELSSKILGTFACSTKRSMLGDL